MIGKLFNNRYEIKEKLGSGGTSIVYRGFDTLLGRMVTIKILREEFANDEDFVRRFRREAQAVASLSHGNIVSVYDVGYEENMYYIVMEFVEGESVKERIRRVGALDATTACTIMCQVLDGLQYAHERGIIHRDIKPHNILLSSDGRAKVTDFGIAVGMSDATITYSSSQRIQGSVHYISPEQVQGQKVTEKSDIYSAGVLFYELLTGQLPYSGDSAISVAMQHVQNEAPAPHIVNPAVPVGLSYVVTRAMRKSADSRYASAREMSDAIRAAMEGFVPHLVPPYPAEEETRDLTDTAAAAAAAAAEQAKAVKQDAKPAPQPEPEPEVEEERPYKEKKSSAKTVLLGGIAACLVALLIMFIIFIKIVTGGGGSEKIEIPNLVGDPYLQAEAELNDIGFDRVAISMVEKEDVAHGTVISIDPKPGHVVSAGHEITLIVSSGDPLVEVPTVLGMTEAMADLTLERAGLTAKYTTAQHNTVEEGLAIRQDPAAGEEVEEGTEVEVVISLGSGRDKHSLPALKGQTVDVAVASLESMNIKAEIVEVESYNYHTGVVISQNFPEGHQLEEGKTVRLTVSKGPGPQEADLTLTHVVQGSRVVVRIVINDAQGEREVYRRTNNKGAIVTQDVTYYGEGTVTIYEDDTVMSTQNVN